MAVVWYAARVLIAAVIVVAVADLSKRYPRVGALLLSLPLVSILAFLQGWFRHQDLPTLSRLARETLVLVPLGLPFFLPLAFAQRLGFDFWTALIAGMVLASMSIGCWLYFFPQNA